MKHIFANYGMDLHEAPRITRRYGRAVWFHSWVHTPKSPWIPLIDDTVHTHPL